MARKSVPMACQADARPLYPLVQIDVREGGDFRMQLDSAGKAAPSSLSKGT
jgi:hypothetical protein